MNIVRFKFCPICGLLMEDHNVGMMFTCSDELIKNVDFKKPSSEDFARIISINYPISGSFGKR